jgi:hypothetical protein
MSYGYIGKWCSEHKILHCGSGFYKPAANPAAYRPDMQPLA